MKNNEVPKIRWWRAGRFWLIASFLTVLSAAPFAPWLFDDWQTERKLASAISEANESNPAWRYDELAVNRPEVAQEVNAATQVLKVASFFPEKSSYNPACRSLPLPPGLEKKTEKYNDWIFDVYSSIIDVPDAAQLNEQQMVVIRGEWREWPLAFDAARKLRHFRTGRSSTRDFKDPINLKLHNGAVSASRLLFFDVLGRCQVEQYDEAMDSCLASFVIARAMREEPFALAAWSRGAWLHYAIQSTRRILAQCEGNPDRLAEIQKCLEDEEGFAHFNACVNSWRAETWATFRYYQEGHGTPEERKDFEALEQGLDRLARFDEEPIEKSPWYHKWIKSARPDDPRLRQAEDLSRAGRWQDFAKKPFEDQVAEFESYKSELTKAFPLRKLDIIGSQFEKIRNLKMQLRIAVVAVAAERYRIAKGEWPKSLDQLAPEFVSTVPSDFFTRKPLQYRRVEKGILLYSTGPDGKDNGGKFIYGPDEYGSPFQMPGLDIGVQLWNVQHRRQPPLPPVQPRVVADKDSS